MNTTAMVKEAKKMASELGIMRNIIRGEEFRVGGFGGRYYPYWWCFTIATSTKAIAWVGKGIVYNTSGLRINGKTAMPDMKTD